MNITEIDQKLLRLRKFANFVITPLFVLFLLAYFIQKSTTTLVIILAVVAVFLYLGYGITVCYYIWKRHKLQKNN